MATKHNFTNSRQFLLLFILTGFIAGSVMPDVLQAQSDTTRWTPELSMQYDQITETEISPDGDYVAYFVEKSELTKYSSK